MGHPGQIFVTFLVAGRLAAAECGGYRSADPRRGYAVRGRGMDIYGMGDFDDHERVISGREAEAGLRSIVAVHSTALGTGGRRLPHVAYETRPKR